MRWAREDSYDTLIAAAIRTHGNRVTVPLVKALISVESGFVPNAYRDEPHIRDGSHGLMQVLYRTALGTGWMGTESQLFDPATNIGVGVDFLSGLVRDKGGDVWAAVSAYNNGHGKRATVPVTTCLARGRDGVCLRSYTARVGEFYNQPYVDKVRAALAYFTGNASDSTAPASLSLWPLALGSAILWLTLRQR